MDEVVERHHGRRPELRGPTGGGGADLISALPTDLLLQVLVRLRCARAATRTGLLSRCWRGLWSRLPDLTFRDVAPGPLLAVLSSLGPGGASLSLLDIRVPLQHRVTVHADHISSLLRAAARLSPAALRFATSQCLEEPFVDVDLSHCFQRAASIELRGQHLQFADPRWELPALESLSLTGCLIDLAVLIPLCPRLRVLRVAGVFVGNDAITVLSSSLQELVVESNSTLTHHIHVEAPLLKQLMMSFHISGELNVSISAPMLEKVSWRCLYSKVTAGLGLWGLLGVRLLLMEESNVQWVLPRVHVLCLLILAKYSHSDPDEELRFAVEIEKHMITDFSTLELHLTTLEHAFGAFLLRLLGMHRIRTATQSLKISLHRFEMNDGCSLLQNCPCHKPKNWRTQTISLTNLEKLEITGFEQEDHEFDSLKLILRSAPMLKRVMMGLSKRFTPDHDWWTKIHNIFIAYPSVECNIDHSLE